MLGLIPPIAVPVSPAAIAKSVAGAADSARDTFAADLAKRFNASSVALFGSGRGALLAILSSLPREGRREVLVPAYTCWSVPAAVVRAGLRVRLYDLDPLTFRLAKDLDPAAYDRAAAVILADLLSVAPGLESDADSIRRQNPELCVVIDRAQSWPGEASAGGLTLLSFGRGKPMPLGGGGAVLARGVPCGIQGPNVRKGGLGGALTLAMVSLLGHPECFRGPASIPALGIGTTVFDPAFDEGRPFRRWQDRLGCALMPRMAEFEKRRREHAARLSEVVAATRGWSVGPWTGGPLRLPVYAASRGLRDRMITALGRHGVSASALYPGTLRDIASLRSQVANSESECPGAQEIADRLLTLPVYPTLGTRDMDRIARAFSRSASEVAS